MSMCISATSLSLCIISVNAEKSSSRNETTINYDSQDFYISLYFAQSLAHIQTLKSTRKQNSSCPCVDAAT